MSDWSSDMCSSDLSANSFDIRLDHVHSNPPAGNRRDLLRGGKTRREYQVQSAFLGQRRRFFLGDDLSGNRFFHQPVRIDAAAIVRDLDHDRSEEHTSELQSLMRLSYAVFCLKKKNT